MKVREAARPVHAPEKLQTADRRSLPFRVVGALLLAALVAAAWRWTPLRGLLDLDRLAAWIEPHRGAWYALPIVMLAFVLLGFLMVPVAIPILAAGLAFGPWRGSLYALVGALTTASLGFAIGRWIDPERVERLAGPKAPRWRRMLQGNGALAVFLIRKAPLPSAVVSVALGAFGASYRDFLLGSMLGLVPLILALDAFEGSLARALKDPTPGNVAVTALFLAVPLILAVAVNRALKRSRMDA